MYHYNDLVSQSGRDKIQEDHCNSPMYIPSIVCPLGNQFEASVASSHMFNAFVACYDATSLLFWFGAGNKVPILIKPLISVLERNSDELN